jgi:hypothetical protein
MSEMYENVKKGLEEAIDDAKGIIKLERHTVVLKIMPQKSLKKMMTITPKNN